MEEGRRSGDPSGFMVKNRSSSGCLIVRKKGNNDGIGIGGIVGSSGSRKFSGSKKEKKRARLDFSDSGSSDELLIPPQRRVGPETIRVCNGLSLFDKGGINLEENDIGRKRSRGDITGRSSNKVDANVVGRNGEEDFSARKRNRLDVFEFDEYEGNDVEMMRRRRKHFDDDDDDNNDDDGIQGRGRLVGSMMMGRSGINMEYESGSSRHPIIDRRKSSYFERTSGLIQEGHHNRDVTRNHPRQISFYRDKYDSDEPIRVQGKNGVLKVMVNKKKKVGGMEVEENRKGLRPEEAVKRNVLIRPPLYSESKSAEKSSSVVGTLKSSMNMLRSSPAKNSSSRNGKVRYHDSEDSDTSLKLGLKKLDSHNSMKMPPSTKNLKGDEVDSEDSDTSLKLGPKNEEPHKSTKGASSSGEITPSNQRLPTRSKEGKIKRGTGTEKQKLRERIREMLLNAGWTIDYRPRRNRDYLDAVYINPTGTAYWSIIKAYDALLKQLNDEEEEARSKDESFMPLSDEVLSQLTRKTRKKMEKEMKMKKKQRDVSESENARETAARKSSSSRHDEESMDSGSHEEKLSSFIKQGGKSLKSRMNGNSSFNLNTKNQNSIHPLHGAVEQTFSGCNSHQGRKSRKLGRCTLLVRNSNEGLNSESDGFVPYAGKRTLLSWLIDCGAVQLSQKVRYMNRRRTKVMLEGWVTRDGIHCGCCSKILTVSKFEIHAGSKLRQPFQNIYLDSGVSLLECQIDAWNRQESIERIGFHSVNTDGDDPNDDTCGICGDGGDLICCDGCPSTFHQSCLDIMMLPPGDWHCPNCTCKFCGIASEDFVQEDGTNVSELLTCSLCAKKYHKSCLQDVDALCIDFNNSTPCFCGKTCRELFEQLQKYLGIKHELESGFSWSLVHRMDIDLDMSLQGLPQRVECNSKLAVALSVMDECFLPIVDRRSGINIIQNVLYNCGSNFNRLNYSGFYAAILERGDEIISAASIRFHGTQLAEMPFIGTRHVYRRQGMCRRLFSAIESALCSLKVQKLIIPAISELTHTWTGVFGFTTLSDSLKQELKSMNMLVFPGIDMLQKQLLEKENTDGNMTLSAGFKGSELEDSQCVTPEVAAKSDIDSSAMHDLDKYDINGDLEHASRANDEVVTANSDSQFLDVPMNDTSVISSSLDSTQEQKNLVLLIEMVNADFDSGDKLDESAAENKSLSVFDASHDNQMDIKAESDSSAEDTTRSCIQGEVSPANSNSRGLGVSSDDISVKSGSVGAPNELKTELLRERNTCADSESGDKLDELNSESKCLVKTVVASPVKDDFQSCKESDIQDIRAFNLNETSSDKTKTSISIEEAKSLDCKSEGKFSELASKGNHQFDSDAGHHAIEMETKPVVDSPIEDKPESGKEDLQTLNAELACSEAVPSTKGASEFPSVSEAAPSAEDVTDDNSTQKIDEFLCVPDAVPSTENATDDKPTQKIDELQIVPESVPSAQNATGDKPAQKIYELQSVSEAVPSAQNATDYKPAQKIYELQSVSEAVPSAHNATDDKSTQKMGEFPSVVESVPSTEDATDDNSTQKIDEFLSVPGAVPSTESATDDNHPPKMDELPSVPVSMFNGGDDNSMQNNLDPKDRI
ncbi:uncharacterized protein LOC8280925 [Ricinus communis]|uniref:uncharacterized protein LOC8280925 n=1 Tax=Ricinus communis TaxID=3988 RepID=UPI00201B103A|nr:uncharacterized protein LOC8280925 [Ricinus communis]